MEDQNKELMSHSTNISTPIPSCSPNVDRKYLDSLSLEVLSHILSYLPILDCLIMGTMNTRLKDAMTLHLRTRKAIDFAQGKLYSSMIPRVTDSSLVELFSRCKDLRYIYGFHPVFLQKRRSRHAKQLSIRGVIDALSHLPDLRGIELSNVFLLEAILTYLPKVEILGMFKNRNRRIPDNERSPISLPSNPRITSLNLSGVAVSELPPLEFAKHIHLNWVTFNQHPFKEFKAPNLQTFVMTNCAGPTNALKYVPLITALALARPLTRLMLVRVPFLGGLIQHLVEEYWRIQGFRNLRSITLGTCKNALEVDLGFLIIACAFRLEELCIQPSLTKDSLFSSLNVSGVQLPHFDSLSLGFVDPLSESKRWTNKDLISHGLADIVENPAMITDIGMKMAGKVFRLVKEIEIYNCPHLHYPTSWSASPNFRGLRELTLRRCHAIRLVDFCRFIPMLPVLESLHLESMFNEPPKGCARVGLSAGTGLGVSSALVSNTGNEAGINDDDLDEEEELANQIPVNNNNDGEPANQGSRSFDGPVPGPSVENSHPGLSMKMDETENSKPGEENGQTSAEQTTSSSTGHDSSSTVHHDSTEQNILVSKNTANDNPGKEVSASCPAQTVPSNDIRENQTSTSAQQDCDKTHNETEILPENLDKKTPETGLNTVLSLDQKATISCKASNPNSSLNPRSPPSKEDPRPRSPSFNGDPRSPPFNGDPRPRSPPSNGDPRPRSPPFNGDPRPRSPPSNGDPRSRSPPSNGDPRPRSPPSNGDPRPRSPPSNDGPRPRSPPSNGDPRPRSPPSNGDPRPRSPPSNGDPRPRSPPSDPRPGSPSNGDPTPRSPPSNGDPRPRSPPSNRNPRTSPRPKPACNSASPKVATCNSGMSTDNRPTSTAECIKDSDIGCSNSLNIEPVSPCPKKAKMEDETKNKDYQGYKSPVSHSQQFEESHSQKIPVDPDCGCVVCKPEGRPVHQLPVVMVTHKQIADREGGSLNKQLCVAMPIPAPPLPTAAFSDPFLQNFNEEENVPENTASERNPSYETIKGQQNLKSKLADTSSVGSKKKSYSELVDLNNGSTKKMKLECTDSAGRSDTLDEDGVSSTTNVSATTSKSSSVKGKSQMKGKGKGKKSSAQPSFTELQSCFEKSQESHRPGGSCLQESSATVFGPRTDSLFTESEESGFKSMDSQSGFKSMDSQSGFKSMDLQSGFKSMDSQSGFKSMDSQSGFKSMDSQSGFKSMDSQSGFKSMDSQSGFKSMDSQSGFKSMDSQSGFKSMDSQSGFKSMDSQSGWSHENKNSESLDSLESDPMKNPTLSVVMEENEEREEILKVTVSGDTSSSFLSTASEFESQANVSLDSSSVLSDGLEDSRSEENLCDSTQLDDSQLKQIKQTDNLSPNLKKKERKTDKPSQSDSSTTKVNKGKTPKGKNRSYAKSSKGKVNQACQAVSDEIRETTKRARDGDKGRRVVTSSRNSVSNKASVAPGAREKTGSMKRKLNTCDQSTSTSDPVMEDDHVQVLNIRSQSLVNLTLHRVGVTDIVLQDCPFLNSIQATSCRVLKKVKVEKAHYLQRVTFAQCRKLDELHLMEELCKLPSRISRNVFIRPMKEINLAQFERLMFNNLAFNYHMCLVRDFSPDPTQTVYNRTRVVEWSDMFFRMNYDLTMRQCDFAVAKRSKPGNGDYPWGRRIYTMQGYNSDSCSSSWDLITDIPWLQPLSECPNINPETLSSTDIKEGVYCPKIKGHTVPSTLLERVEEQKAELHEIGLGLFNHSIILFVNTCDSDGIPTADVYV